MEYINFEKLRKFIIQKQDIVSLALIIIIFTSFYYPLFVNINLPIDNSDYYRCYYRLGVLKKICLEYKQIPLRNPFLSGGYPILGDPYIFVLNPFYIFILIFGEITGIRIVMFVLLLFCAIGMHYLTRYVLKYNCTGSVFSTCMFMLAGWGVNQIKGGNYQNLYYYPLPWLLAFLIKGTADKRFIVLGCFVLSLIVIESGLVIIPVMLFLLMYACSQIKINFKNRKIAIDVVNIKSLFSILVFALLLCSIKILPAIDLLRMRLVDYIHFVGEHSYTVSSYLSKVKGHAMNLSILHKALLDSSYIGSGQMYLGIVPCVFFLVSSVIFIKENWRYLLILTIFIILLFGSHSPIDLFKLFWNIHPIMHGIWKLDKFFAFFAFFLISLIGGRLFLFPERIIKFSFFTKFILVIIGTISIINIFIVNSRNFTFPYIKYPEIKRSPNYSSFFQVKLKDYIVTGPFDDYNNIPDEKFARFYWLSMLQGFGVTNSILGGNFVPIKENIIPKYFIDNKYYDELKQSGSIDSMRDQKLNQQYKGEVFFLRDENHASFNYFSPNKLEVFAQLNIAPDILIINQRYDAGWKCDIGRLHNWHDLLAIKLESPGNYSVLLRYRPKSFFLGIGISLVTAIGLCFFYKKSHSILTNCSQKGEGQMLFPKSEL